MGNVSAGAGKYRSNSAGPGSNVQGSGAVSDLVQQQELSDNWGDAQGLGGVSPTGGITDHRTDGKDWGRRRVVVPLGSGGNKRCGAPPTREVH